MGLAPLLVEEIFRVVQELNQQGATVLLVEQNARAALRIAHQGYVLETGRVVMSASARELLSERRYARPISGTEAAGSAGARRRGVKDWLSRLEVGPCTSSRS